MLLATIILTALGVALGVLLGIAARFFKVEEDPIVENITDLLPGANCGQCGFAGCAGCAEAIAAGEAKINCCPPGGKALAEQLAALLHVPLDANDESSMPVYAHINAELCTGCTRCYRACPTDAIVGANGQIHSVILNACTGCGKCENACPEDCVALTEQLTTLDSWHWPKPAAA